MAVDLEHLWPPFRAAVEHLIAESKGRVTIVSAYRSVELQKELYDAKVRSVRGSHPGWSTQQVLLEAGRWVAPPGRSNHGPKLDMAGHQPGPFGRAVDFGGDLTLAHRLAPHWLIHQAMPWEAWHFEPNPELYTAPALAAPAPEEVHLIVSVIDAVAAVPRAQGGGWEFGKRGHVYAWDGAPHFGGWPETNPEQAEPGGPECVALVPTLTGGGYWLVNGAGEVFSYGDAVWPGNYRPEWGDLPIVGAFTNARGGHPCGGVTLARLDSNLYRLPA